LNRPDEHPGNPQALSLWADLESPDAFACYGLHAEALRHRKGWFAKPPWPTDVAWRVADAAPPTWAEAHAWLAAWRVRLHDAARCGGTTGLAGL
jgi:hypothetical protein